MIPIGHGFDESRIRFINLSQMNGMFFIEKFGFLQEANGMKFTRTINDDETFTQTVRGPDYRWRL